MGCCAVGTCTKKRCRLCQVVAKLPAKMPACGAPVYVNKTKITECSLIEGHDPRIPHRDKSGNKSVRSSVV